MQFTPAPHITQNWQLDKARGVGPARHGRVARRRTPQRPALRCWMPAAMRSTPRSRLRSHSPRSSHGIPGSAGSASRVVHRAGETRAEAVDFGPTAPAALDPVAFTLTGEVAADLFGWPEVEGDGNIHGPLSF